MFRGAAQVLLRMDSLNHEDRNMESSSALLLIQDEQTVLALKRALGKLGIESQAAPGCRQALELLDQGAAAMVFTDPSLPDGTWEDVVMAASRRSHPVPVVVVSNTVDYRLYIETLGGGAADFIMPPFMALDVAFVVRQVREKALDSARHAARAAAPGGQDAV
jgi:DNA-binding NtrC family response regulator